MKQLKDILKQSLAKKGLLKVATSAEICFYAENWGKIPFTAISFSNGLLKIAVNSSAAASELQMEENNLIEFLNKKIGKELVKRVRIINKG